MFMVFVGVRWCIYICTLVTCEEKGLMTTGTHTHFGQGEMCDGDGRMRFSNYPVARA